MDHTAHLGLLGHEVVQGQKAHQLSALIPQKIIGRPPGPVLQHSPVQLQLQAVRLRATTGQLPYLLELPLRHPVRNYQPMFYQNQLPLFSKVL
ncbi:hypothetical protein D3C71_1771450 [compost metagenome]